MRAQEAPLRLVSSPRRGYFWSVSRSQCHVLLVCAASPVLIAAEPLVEGRRRVWSQVERSPLASDVTTTSLTGRLFYEDHRQLGRHTTRRDPDGKPGRRPKQRTQRHQRYLAAHLMTVEMYEVDDARGRGCVPLAWVGTAAVGPDGTFSAEVPANDSCAAESESEPRYVLAAHTSHCEGDLCFYVGRRVEDAYTLWFGVGSPFAGPTMPDLVFLPARGPRLSVEAQAANHHASLVDVVVAFHVEADIPFRREEFGAVTVRYPSPYSDGRATRADLIDANNQGWPKGGLILHEYGHIVHRRAWGGDYAGYPTPIQRWNGKSHSREVPFIALKEGWANFTAAYVTGRCFRSGYDTANTLVSLQREVNGIHFPQNHHRALCDWVDRQPDQRPGTARGDTMTTDLYTLWQTLDTTDELWADRGHTPGLNMCDLAATYVVSGSVDGRWARFDAVAGVLETNDIACPGLRMLPITQVAVDHRLSR